MKCSKCGQELLNDVKFCTNCGSNIVINENNSTPLNTLDNKKKTNLRWIIIIVLLSVILVLCVLLLNKKDNKVIVGSTGGTRTIMMYVVGSNLESNSKIVTAELKSIDYENINLDEVNILLYTGGTTKWHTNYISNEENAIFELTKEGFIKKETYNQENMGDPNTLTTFLNYGYDNYKTDLYDLLIYDHGGAIDGAIYDDFSNDNLSLSDFEEALENSPFKKHKLESVIFRTCLNGTIEIANIFKDYANYMVASEEVTVGYKTSSVLNYVNNLNSDLNGIDYSKTFIDAYQNQINDLDPSNIYAHMYSIIDLNKVDTLIDELNRFISGIDMDKYYGDIVRIRDGLIQYGYTFRDDKSFDTVDLKTMINRLSDYSSVSSDKVLKAFEEAVIYNWSNTEECEGLSIYFPYRADKKVQKAFLNEYENYEELDDYNDFINDFYNQKSSSKQTSFNKGISEKAVSTDGKEFSVELTDEQLKDYAGSIYLVFRYNESDDTFSPVYSSDNATLKDNVLTSNMNNNLMKAHIIDADTKEEMDEYLFIWERTNGSHTVKASAAVAHNWDSSLDLSEWETVAVQVYFDFDDDGNPFISSMTEINYDDASANGTLRYLDEFTILSYATDHYKVTDEMGNYTPNWKKSGIFTGFEYSTKDSVTYHTASLNDGTYYGVFILYDIYENRTYSKFIEIK